MARTAVALHFGDGSIITSVTQFTLRDAYVDPLTALEFEAHPLRHEIADYRTRLDKGQLVTVTINGVSQGGYLVQTVRTRVGRDGVVFAVSAQAPLVTAYQGGVNPDLSLHHTTDAPITQAVLEALAPYGFDRIVGDTAANVRAISGKRLDGRKPSIVVEALTHQDAQAQVGESAYAFAARLFSRVGVCLRMAADGTLLLGAPDYEQAAAYGVGQTFGASLPVDTDRFLDGLEVADSNDEQFSEVVVRGERGDKKGAKQTARPLARVVGPGSEALRPAKAPFASVAPTTLPESRASYRADAAAAGYKPLFIDDRHARDAQRCRSVGTLAMGLRRKDAFTVTGSVAGFISRTGVLWQVDTVARVIVEAAALDENMWIAERTFQQSTAGQITMLKLIPLHSLVLGEVPS